MQTRSSSINLQSFDKLAFHAILTSIIDSEGDI
jgi:hypothetical protein